MGGRLFTRVYWVPIIVTVVLVSSLLVIALLARTVHAQDPDWTDQFGSTDSDNTNAIAVDASGVYVAGHLRGQLANQSDPDQRGTFIRKYDHQGTELWIRWIHESDIRLGRVSVDATGIYILGTMPDALSPDNPGCTDSLIRKYSLQGDLLWSQEFGTPENDIFLDLSAYSSAVYVVGSSGEELECVGEDGDFDTFVRKYNASSGALMWTRGIATPARDVASGISADASGVYVGGRTHGALPGQTRAGEEDSYVRKYNHDGAVLWTRQFGTPRADMVSSVSAHSTGVYVGGSTGGPLADAVVGHTDAFVRKYDGSGTLLWTRQFGDAWLDYANGISVDAQGVHAAGRIYIPPPSYPGIATEDAFLQSYDHHGNATWTQYYGTDCEDEANAITAHSGRVYVVGSTRGTLPGESHASGAQCSLTEELPYYDTDIFVAAFTLPAPSSPDAVAPVGSMQVEGGATYTNTADASAALSATDPMPRTGLASTRFSNDGKSWSSWQSYSSIKAWTLGDTDGSKQVYTQFRDASGNLSVVKSDSIILDTVAPTPAAPAHSLAAGTTLGTSTIPVRLTWSATDATSGVARYQLQQRKYTNGAWGAWGWVTQGTPAKTLTRQLAPGTYQLQVRAQDRAGNWSAWKQGISFTLAPYQETSTATAGKASYTGTWSSQSLSSHYGGTARYSSIKGSTVSFAFTGGKQVAWVAPRGVNRGYAYVYLDGVKVATVNLYASSAQYRKVVYAKSGLSPSVTHTLKVYVTGTKPTASTGTRVDVDGFVVLR